MHRPTVSNTGWTSMIGFRVHIFDSKMPKPLQPFCPSALARPHLVQGFTLSCSTVGDVVQLVRTLPRRWLESHTVTADSFYPGLFACFLCLLAVHSHTLRYI